MNGTDMVLKIGLRQGWSYQSNKARDDEADSFDRVIQGHDPAVVAGVFTRLMDGWKVGRRIMPGDLLDKLQAIPKQEDTGRNNRARNEWVNSRRREIVDRWLSSNPEQAFCAHVAKDRAHNMALREYDDNLPKGVLVLSPKEVAVCRAQVESWKRLRAA